MEEDEKEMIELLAKRFEKPELFNNIKFVDGNPILEGFLDIGDKLEDIEASFHQTFIKDENIGGVYISEYDSIYIRKLKNDCHTLYTYEKTLNLILHEVAHRIQYTKLNYEHDDQTVHGVEFQRACLELGLLPSREVVYGEHKLIEHDEENDELYDWMCLVSMVKLQKNGRIDLS